MAYTVTVPDLATTTNAFDLYAKSINVSIQSDGKGGKAYMATLTADIVDSNGKFIKSASYSVELTPTQVTSLRNFTITNLLPGLRAQEGL